MTDSPIEPALTPEEWHILRLRSAGKMIGETVRGFLVFDQYKEDQVAAIAVANAALPDSDPHKITWAMVDDLREVDGRLDDDALRPLVVRIADVLASYLPPREPPMDRSPKVGTLYQRVL